MGRPGANTGGWPTRPDQGRERIDDAAELVVHGRPFVAVRHHHPRHPVVAPSAGWGAPTGGGPRPACTSRLALARRGGRMAAPPPPGGWHPARCQPRVEVVSVVIDVIGVTERDTIMRLEGMRGDVIEDEMAERRPRLAREQHHGCQQRNQPEPVTSRTKAHAEQSIISGRAERRLAPAFDWITPPSMTRKSGTLQWRACDPGS